MVVGNHGDESASRRGPVGWLSVAVESSGFDFLGNHGEKPSEGGDCCKTGGEGGNLGERFHVSGFDKKSDQGESGGGDANEIKAVGKGVLGVFLHGCGGSVVILRSATLRTR